MAPIDEELQQAALKLRTRMYEIRDQLKAMGLKVGCNPMEWYLPGKQQYTDERPKKIFAFRFRVYHSSFRVNVDKDYIDVVAPLDATAQKVLEMTMDILISGQTPDI